MLVATDRSESADRAVRWAADMAERYEAELLVLQVVAERAAAVLPELEQVLNRRAGLVGGRRLVDLIRAGAEEHVLDVVAAAKRRAG